MAGSEAIASGDETGAQLAAPAQRRVQFHILSFEGPDPYAQAGGIASRVTGLAEALVANGFDTHVWFVGDPALPGHESRRRLTLHRWCQWISRYHPAGVYDGEEGKRTDYANSLPPFLVREVLLPHLAAPDGKAVVLAEEWQTVDAVLHLDWLLRDAGLRDRVTVAWNANNTFSFERIDWRRLAEAAVITTVSRYMRHLMQPLGVDPLVIPNGLSPEALLPPERAAVVEFRHRLRRRTVFSKVARWDPNKRWLVAIEIIAELKRLGWRPLLIARGGIEGYGSEVLRTAATAGLRVRERCASEPGVRGLLEALDHLDGVDVLSLGSALNAESRRVLFRGCSAVLANSGHEPFGLVGLETMAAGGVACTGCSGEDYAVAGQNALVLQTASPREFLALFQELEANPVRQRAMRRAGQATARRYVWGEIVEHNLLPRFRLLASPRHGAQAA